MGKMGPLLPQSQVKPIWFIKMKEPSAYTWVTAHSFVGIHTIEIQYRWYAVEQSINAKLGNSALTWNFIRLLN